MFDKRSKSGYFSNNFVLSRTFKVGLKELQFCAQISNKEYFNAYKRVNLTFAQLFAYYLVTNDN
jgi:hypothetical protein